MDFPELPIVHPEPDDDDASSDEPPTVLLTGAAGAIGRKLRAAWGDDYDLVLLDLRGEGDPEIIEADLSQWDDDWASTFDGVDVVVHMAANADQFASWEDLIAPNLDAMTNVFLAAAMSGVSRVIFASSNHAMGGYQGTEVALSPDIPPNPDGPYGATKVMGERIGKCFAKAFDLSVVALRIGWVQRDENVAATLPDAWGRSMWLSDGDLDRLIRAAIEADLEANTFLIANGVSRNAGSRWTLREASEELGYEPQDDANAPTTTSPRTD